MYKLIVLRTVKMHLNVVDLLPPNRLYINRWILVLLAVSILYGICPPKHDLARVDDCVRCMFSHSTHSRHIDRDILLCSGSIDNSCKQSISNYIQLHRKWKNVSFRGFLIIASYQALPDVIFPVCQPIFIPIKIHILCISLSAIRNSIGGVTFFSVQNSMNSGCTIIQL